MPARGRSAMPCSTRSSIPSRASFWASATPCCASADRRAAPMTWSPRAGSWANTSFVTSRRFPNERVLDAKVPSERFLVRPEVDLVRPGAAVLAMEMPVAVGDRLDVQKAVRAGLVLAVGHARQQPVALDAGVDDG